MPLDTESGKNKRYTKESTLEIMADYIKGLMPGGSCHTQVAHWIKTQEDFLPTDEIVMFGETFFEKAGAARDAVAHSLIMRDNEVIADPFDSGKYNPEDKNYHFTIGANDENVWEYQEFHRVTLQDFFADYRITPSDLDYVGAKPQVDTGDEPGF